MGYNINELIKVQRELYSKPLLIGNKFAVKVLTVHNRHFHILDDVIIPDKIMIDINPEFVFGDGTHATTQMVTEALEKYIQEDINVLDIGCGTGIQSICALKLGASHANAIDIEPSAIGTATRNAELNGVSDKFVAVESDLLENVNGKYDLVIANILPDPILRLLKDIDRVLNDSSTIILSGIQDFREEEIVNAVSEKFDIVERNIRDGWVCLVMRAKA